MKIGAMNHPVKNAIEEIDWIAANGFDFVDFTFEPPSAEKMEIAKIKRKLYENNLGVVGHTNPTLPAIYPVRAIREVCLLELRKSADFFALLGAKKMTFHPFYYGSHQTQEERIESNIIVLKEMVAYCQEIGIKAMIENYIAPFDRPETISKILDQVPNLYVHLDIGHCNLGDEPEKTVEIFFKTFKEKVLHLHVHDNNGDEDEHLPLGCGEIDWGKMIGIAKKFKYDSTITLEVFCTDKDFLLISKKKILKLWNK